MSNFKILCSQLKSEKFKERQQGIASLREAFARDTLVENLDEKGDGRAWLVLFQALFTAVVNERAVATKKGLHNATAITLRRLEEAASTVRWITERSITRLNKKVVKPLLAHLLQTIVYQDKLCSPVALDYAKTLRIVLSYTPHLEHLEIDHWIRIVSLSFAVVLGDNLKSSIGDGPEVSGSQLSSGHSENEGPSQRKRRRQESTSKPLMSKNSGSQHLRTVSLEQIEFMALIALLLRSSSAPYLSPDYPGISRAIFDRLVRFFASFPSDTSAHLDAVLAVNAALDQLVLNAREQVIDFGVKIWDHLSSLWSTKNRKMKEGILMALITLFPFVTYKDAPFDIADGIGRLFRLLSVEYDSRWGIEPLSLDALRLDFTQNCEREEFEAGTFRYGFDFNGPQALAWAALQLQADCAKELYLLTESTHSTTPSFDRGDSKRIKLDNPVTSLLQSIQMNQASQTRKFHLQGLLFIIDRHWPIFHAELHQEVVNTLLQLVTVDDPVVQSWVFLCFAAIAHADSVSPNIHIQWDGIWNHTMRRTNVSHVCRAACHAAHVIMVCKKLPMHRILAEVETMAQDLHVQGPTAPFDSVCSFLIECLRVASQDIRLYRMQLEDRVLSWLTENWDVLGGSAKSLQYQGRFKMEQYTVHDLLCLLENTCGLSRRSHLLCPILLPDTAIVNILRDHQKTTTIREFYLHASLQTSKKPKTGFKPSISIARPSQFDWGNDLALPSARERKTSAFLLKALESVSAGWEFRNDTASRPPAERLRRLIDLAILAFFFESSLVANGVRCNRRVLLTACKLISFVSPLLKDASWSSEEKVLILSGFAPLTADERKGPITTTGWPALAPLGQGTGIRQRKMGQVETDDEAVVYEKRSSRRRLQKLVWQNSDVRDALGSVMAVFKILIETLAVGTPSANLTPSSKMEVDDDRDDFAPVRTVNTIPMATENSQIPETSAYTRYVASLGIELLSLAPILQSSGGEPTRDKILTDLVCECDDDVLGVLVHPFLDHVQKMHLYMSVANLEKLLDRFQSLLMSYAHSRSEETQSVVVHLLVSTAHIWLQPQVATTDVGTGAREMFYSLLNMLKNKKIRSWRVRDSIVRFLDLYLHLDPAQQFWSVANTTNVDDTMESVLRPDLLLPTIAKDEDMRVRFTVALSCSRLFSASYMRDKDPMVIYNLVREYLCVIVTNYEHMLTRFLCLGNIMIISSAVRRAPYWHLLEVCLHSSSYTRHVESVLSNVAERIGLVHYSELFQAYASQIAYSICLSQQDFFRFPPHLLGYRDRKDCADATFRAFTPTNLLAGKRVPEELAHGQSSFERHCRMINISDADGLLQCFAEIVGYQVVFWIAENYDPCATKDNISQEMSQGLMTVLHRKFGKLGPIEGFQTLLEQHVDRIVVAMLRTIGDLDYHRDGIIVQALKTLDASDRVIRAFRSLMKFRSHEEFEMHGPNLPSFSTVVVLRALRWLSERVPTVNSDSTTYHVLHQVFGEIDKSSLVNEQLRLLHCMCVWISVHSSHFKNGSLLKVLTSGATILLSQPDLSSIARGMLDWAFTHYREVKCDNPYFSDILIRISSIAYHFSQKPMNSMLHATGIRIMDWIEQQMLVLSQSDTARRWILGALAAWPRDLTGDLETLSSSLTCENVSSILNDHHISSQKVKVARRLSELARDFEYSRDQFAKHDFWRIKGCIPKGQFPVEVVDSFSKLLLINAGHICSFDSDSSHLRHMGSRHQKLSAGKREKGRKTSRSSPKQPILMALLDMLADHTSSIVHVAYRTLRLLASLEPLDSSEYGSWPSEYRGDVSFLKFCPTHETRIPQERISGLLDAELLESSQDFSCWVSAVTVLLSGVLATMDPFYGHFTAVLEESEAFAEEMLPVLVHCLLRSNSDIEKKETNARTILSKYLDNIMRQDKVDVHCLRSVVNIVLHLRHFLPEASTDALAYNHWLDVDFMALSRSAITCGAYTTALLFLELATEYRAMDNSDGPIYEQILFDIYSHIDEPDGFYGMKTQDHRDFLMRRFHHELQWDKAFHFHGAGFEAGEMNYRGAEGILESLHSFGFDKLAMTTLQSVGFSGVFSAFSSSSMGYRLGWRTETWDLPEISGGENSGATLYVALRAIHREKDYAVINHTLQHALISEMERLRALGNENLVEIRQVTQNLMCLAQIRNWTNDPIQSNLISKAVNISDEHWSKFCEIHPNFSFPDLENVIATRISLIRSIRQREARDQIGSMLSPLSSSLAELEKKCLMQLSAAARGADQRQIALNSIVRAQQLEKEPTFDVSQEFTCVLWLQREQKFAVEFLKSLIEKDNQFYAPSRDIHKNIQKAFILARLGEWTAEACLEKPEDIQSHFFSPANVLLTNQNSEGASREQSTDQDDARAAVFYKCALFAEKQYHAILKSPDLLRLKVYSERKKQELMEREENIRRTASDPKKEEEKRRAKALYDQDTAQFSGVMNARDSYLNQAVEMLSRCLGASDAHDDDATIRLCSLWFANFTNETLNSQIPSALARISSRKFVFLAHQLSARLSSANESNLPQNQRSLKTLLIRLCSEHPFHSLYQVYSLRAAGPVAGGRRQSARMESQSSSQIDRATAAAAIFNQLRATPKLHDIVRDVEMLCDAYLEWAKLPIRKDPRYRDNKKYPIPTHLKITKITNLKVPVTTVHTPLDRTLLYDDCIWIKSYAPEFETAGGMNLPKISICNGSDGSTHKQLFKGEGEDDLRQDAVMEQVFELCNLVLRRDRETRKRELNIRSYKVVPLTSQAGVLEFVGNTTSLQNWLSIAHPRYYPKDITLIHCASLMSEIYKQTRDDKERSERLLKVFKDIRRRFHPVMRHFFTETHKTPLAWFGMRLNYSRSVATTSIVGHILGLGDRHTSNILIDRVSGEVVHIDLGIAFDQGKLLRVPEIIPFRLTADMVDGFGLSGTEGVFRRCAEETLRVLREGSDVITTVLEVFKHDPLHSWSASAVKIQRAQGTSVAAAAETTAAHHQTHETSAAGLGIIGIDMDSGMEDEAADRALSGVARKLDKALSVEYTVNELIAEATDIENLALIFPGWKPFC